MLIGVMLDSFLLFRSFRAINDGSVFCLGIILLNACNDLETLFSGVEEPTSGRVVHGSCLRNGSLRTCDHKQCGVAFSKNQSFLAPLLGTIEKQRGRRMKLFKLC